jgi:hypothetical protein
MLLALTIEQSIWNRKIVFRMIFFGLVSATGLFLVFEARRGYHPHYGPLLAYENIEIARHAETLEYLPSCRPFQRGDKSDGTAALIAEHVIREKPSDEIPVFYYPFLEIRWNGKPLPTKCDPKTGFIVVGKYRGSTLGIETKPLQPERIGNAVSLASLMIVLFGAVYSAIPGRAQLRRADPREQQVAD